MKYTQEQIEAATLSCDSYPECMMLCSQKTLIKLAQACATLGCVFGFPAVVEMFKDKHDPVGRLLYHTARCGALGLSSEDIIAITDRQNVN